MESTTLITFLLHKSNATIVELYGSWDNFAVPWEMKHDRCRGPGHWSGCHKFRNIVYDGISSGLQPRRHGGLTMGGLYWFYYRINGDDEHYDPSLPSTTACPLLPGQRVNVLEVPHDKAFVSKSDSSFVAMVTAMHTINPDDRYRNPRPAPKPRLPRLITKLDAQQLTSRSAVQAINPESVLAHRLVKSATYAPTTFLSQIVDKVASPLSTIFPHAPHHLPSHRLLNQQSHGTSMSQATSIDKSRISYPINIPLGVDKRENFDMSVPQGAIQQESKAAKLQTQDRNISHVQLETATTNHRRAFTAQELRPVTQFIHRRTVSDESVLRSSPATSTLAEPKSIARKPVPCHANFLSNINQMVHSTTGDSGEADNNAPRSPPILRYDGLNLCGVELPNIISGSEIKYAKPVDLDKQLPALPSYLVPSPLFSRRTNANAAPVLSAVPKPFALDWALDQQNLQQSRFSVWSVGSEEDDIDEQSSEDEQSSDHTKGRNAKVRSDNVQGCGAPSSSASLTFSDADDSLQSSPMRLSDPFWSPNVISIESKFYGLLQEQQEQQRNDEVVIHDCRISNDFCEQDCYSGATSPVQKIMHDFEYIGPALL